jgi:glycosyltransferase involved in cell wall biosynthesis
VSRPPISVLIPTRNEERDLPACLASVRWAEEIVVVDSESTDRTRALATEAGARVLVRTFDDYSSQKNWALAQLTHPWVLWLDADERVDDALAGAIRALPESPEADGFEIERVNHFLGHRIRHSGWSNDRIVRLFRRDRGLWEGRIHERVTGLARIERLPGRLLHDSYASFGEYMEKLTPYARENARKAYAAGRRAGPLALLIRPPLRFLRMYLGQGGFLDGAWGLVVCGLSAVSVFLKYAILWDASRHGPAVFDREDGLK